MRNSHELLLCSVTVLNYFSWSYEPAAADWRLAAIFFPVIGFLLGMILVLVDFPLRLLASPGLCGRFS